MMKDIGLRLNPEWPLKISIHQEEGSFHQQTGLKFKEEISKVIRLEHSLIWCQNLHFLISRSEIPGKI
jgi:hypothetical protein